MYEVMQSSPAEKVALSWWNILYRVVGGTSGSKVNLATAAALGFPLGQHFACCTCIFLLCPDLACSLAAAVSSGSIG